MNNENEFNNNEPEETLDDANVIPEAETTEEITEEVPSEESIMTSELGDEGIMPIAEGTSVTSNASCNPSSITVSGKTNGSGTISWSLPTVPAEGVISSCKLTGTCTVSDTGNKPATVTVNGTSVSSGVAFTINLGTGNTTSSVAVAATGPHKSTNSTITFSNLVYTVTYTIYHTVTFKDWDGTVLETQQVAEGTSATAPSNPTRTGYKFTGWDVSFSSIASDLTVTAQYVEIIYYTVTFVDWNGTVLKTEQVEQGTSATAPNPTKEGYKFTGWDIDFSNVTSNLTVTAQYVEAVYYTVTFVDWDGTVLKTQTVEEGTSATAPSDPTRTDYLFIGWDKTFNNVTSDLTVTAQYILDTTFSGVGTVIENISGRNSVNLEFNMDWSTQELEIDGHFEIPDCVIGTKYTLFNMTFNNSGTLQSYRVYFIKESTTNTYLAFTTTSSGGGAYRGSVTVTEIDGIISGDYKVTIKTSEDYIDVTIYQNDVEITGSYIDDLSMNANLLTIGDTNSYDMVDGSTLNSIKIVKTKDLEFSWDQQLGTVLERLDPIEWEEGWYIKVSFNDTQYLEYDLTFNAEVNQPPEYLVNLNAEELITHEAIWLLREVSANQFAITFYNPDAGVPGSDVINIGPITHTDSTITLKIKEYCDRDEIYYNGEFLQTTELSFYDQIPRTCWFGKNTYSHPWREDAVITNMQVKQIGAESEESNLVAKYTANIAGVVPTFNSGYTYEVSETENNGIYTVEITSDSDFTSCSFNGKTNLLTVEYLKITNAVTSTYQMFYGCTSLTSINGMLDWDTSNITTMYSMFYNCNNLTALDLSNFNTTKVTKIDWMFYSCSNLTQLDVSNFNTSKVTSMSYMFSGCTNLTSLNVSNFNTSNVTNIRSMFSGCTNLTSLNVSNFNISNVTDMSWMFNGCTNLTSISMNNSDYSSVNKVITELPTRTADSIGTLNTAGVDDISQVDIATAETKFWNVVDKLLVAKYTANIAGVVPTFNDGYTYEVSETENNGVYTVEITSDSDFSSISFKSKTGLITIEYLKITNAVTSMYQLFYGCTSLTSINGMSDWDTSNVTNMSYMLRNCNNLTSLDVSNFNTSNVTTMRYMFGSCESLTSIDVSNFNTSSVTDMGCMFSYCASLTELDVSNFNTSSVTDMISMFHTCSKLTQLDVSNFNTSNVTDMYSMFNNCSKLTELDLSNFNTSKVTDMNYMFQYCYNLTSISMNNSDYSSVNKIIAQLPTRTSDSMGTLNTAGVDDISQVDIATAETKFWNVVESEEPEGLYLVAKYTANAAGVVPTFNDGYTYEVLETENNGIYTVEITSDSDFSSINFKNISELSTIEYLKITNAVTNMYQMFYGCFYLTSINGMSDWDTSNVTDMSYMFQYCYNLTSLDVSNFNTSNVTTMSYMFSSCFYLTSINDMSDWDTGNVTDMSYMFAYCNQLTSLDLSNFNTSNVSNMGYIFDGCTNLASISMNNSDYISVNKIITQLPTRTTDSMGTLNVTGVDDINQVDTTTAQSKFWEVIEEPEISNKNLFPSFLTEWTLDSDRVFLDSNDDYSASITIDDSGIGLTSSNISEIQGKTILLGAESFSGTAIMMLYYNDGSRETIAISKDNNEATINVQDKPCYLYILDNISNNDVTNIDNAYLYIVDNSSGEPEEPDNNELIQGGINDESGAFEDETPNLVKTKYIDISDKKQIMVNVLTDDVYIVKCYLYNANKELVKIIDISADKKRMFGLDLQKLIDEVMNDGNE